MRSRQQRESFTKYLEEHPELRFWQALRAWAGVNFIYTGDKLLPDEIQEVYNLHDTFYDE